MQSRNHARQSVFLGLDMASVKMGRRHGVVAGMIVGGCFGVARILFAFFVRMVAEEEQRSNANNIVSQIMMLV
jgi:hypothetical protein